MSPVAGIIGEDEKNVRLHLLLGKCWRGNRLRGRRESSAVGQTVPATAIIRPFRIAPKHSDRICRRYGVGTQRPYGA